MHKIDWATRVGSWLTVTLHDSTLFVGINKLREEQAFGVEACFLLTKNISHQN